MNGKMRTVGIAMGSAALLAAVASGCGREARPARPAQAPPAFEAQVPEAQPTQPGVVDQPYMQPQQPQMEQQPGMQPGIEQQQPGMQPGYEQQQPGMQPGIEQPGMQPGIEQQQPGIEQPHGMQEMMNERELCLGLLDAASLRVEEIQNGVALVAMPRPGQDMSTLRDLSRRIEMHMGMVGAQPMGEGQQQTGQEPGMPQQQQCRLFDPARRLGARAVVSEDPNALRILLTTEDRQQVKLLRQTARDFVKQGRRGVEGGAAR